MLEDLLRLINKNGSTYSSKYYYEINYFILINEKLRSNCKNLNLKA